MNNRCCKRVYGSNQPFGGTMCSKPVKVEINGKSYCATHDPEAVLRRRQKQEARWQSESEALQEKTKRINEINRRASKFDGLVSALTELDNLGGIGLRCHEIIKLALEEAKK